MMRNLTRSPDTSNFGRAQERSRADRLGSPLTLVIAAAEAKIQRQIAPAGCGTDLEFLSVERGGPTT